MRLRRRRLPLVANPAITSNRRGINRVLNRNPDVGFTSSLLNLVLKLNRLNTCDSKTMHRAER